MTFNQAGNERSFSDLKIKKTRLRNRLRLPRLEKMSKVCILNLRLTVLCSFISQVGATLRSEHLQAGLWKLRQKRQNHDEDRVSQLLAVPRYEAILDEENGDESDDEESRPRRRAVITTRKGWREVMQKWVDDVRELDEEPEVERPPGRRGKLLPITLAKLFGGTIARPPPRRRAQFTEEQLLMELLAAEEEGEAPDAGEMEGSGDDYDSE